MSKSILLQIEKIASAFSLKNEAVYFDDDKTGIPVNTPDENNRNIQLLTDIIYTNCYCRNRFHYKKEKPNAERYSESERSAFTAKLISSNRTIEALDHGWTAEETNETGSVLAAKKEFQIITIAGNYLKQSHTISEIKEGDKMSIRLLKDSSKPGDHFYFISGQEQHDWWLTGSVRFYWNLKPEGASRLLELVSTQFNRFGIPFGLKCCTDPDAYNRNDSGVLYLANCYLSIGIKFVKEVHNSLSDFLNDDVPMFTLKLAKGLSFAENPPWHTISFGQSRSQIIARGLFKAWSQNAPVSKAAEIIMQTIIENDLNPEKFYLNPRSCFEYDFTGFDY